MADDYDAVSMSDPETSGYLDSVRGQVPFYDALQDAAVAAIPFAPSSVLELGIGTGETASRLLRRFPAAQVTGLDSDPDMLFKAREIVHEVSLARIEDPLPDGPWDLVLSVLTVHRLTDEQKQTLFRRVKEQSKSMVIGDFVSLGDDRGKTQVPGQAYPDSAEELASWCEGEIVWSQDDLVVIVADYR
jgi:tRNA (cmo5U34)-methyltransferase